MALVKSGVLLRVHEHRKLVMRAVTIGLVGGVLVHAVHLLFALRSDTAAERLVANSTLYLMALFLSPAYMGLVALWTGTKSAMWLQEGLAAVGRMALTNYLSHSVITALIFNYARQYDQWDRFAGLLLTFVIYGFQLWISPIWLARFRYGPIEWLWRCAAYGVQPIRRAAIAP